MKTLKVTFQLRKTGKKITKEFPLKSPVSNPSINRVFDTKVTPFQKKNDAILYDYEPIETDVAMTAFCKKEKKEVRVNQIYGGFDTPIKCKCGSKVYINDLGECPICNNAKLWHTKTRFAGIELRIETYKCPECGHTEEEPID